MANAYSPRQPVRLSLTLKVGSVATDATTVALTTKDPAGTKTTYTLAGATVTRDSVGNYHVDVTPTLTGNWFYGWTTTGTAAADAEGFFVCLPSVVA